jgi:RecA-family ATPase
MSDLIDDILPEKEIHLIAGASGAGKTTWVLQTLYNEWQRGKPVLGYASHPGKWVYVAADRSIVAVHRRLAALHIPRGAIDIIPAWDKSMTLQGIYQEIEQRKPVLAVIEAFSSFVGEPGGMFQVKSYLQNIHNFIRSSGVTVLGIVESPKMKPHEKYENPRQRVSGVAAWGHFTETVFVIELVNPKAPSSGQRVLYVCSHNSAGMERNGGFDAAGNLTFP